MTNRSLKPYKSFLFVLQACLVLYGLPASTQTIRLGPTACFYQSVADTSNGHYFVFKDDSLLVIDLNQLKVIERRVVVRPDGWESLVYVPVILNGVPHLTAQNGGWVMKLTEEGWQRIDHSYVHKMQVQSAVFTQQDTLYKFGGYGFWSARNFFTWFDTTTGEWDIIPPTGSKKFPPGLMGPVIVAEGQDWYVIQGGIVVPENPTQYEQNDHVWVFRKDRLKWEKLGKLRADFSKRDMDIAVGNRKLVVIEKENASFCLVDVVKNRLSIYPKAFHTLGFYAHAGFSPVCYKGNLYGTRNDSETDQLLINIVPMTKILDLPHTSSRLYDPFVHARWIFLAAGVICGLALSVMAFKRYRKVSYKIQQEGNVLIYRSRKVELDNQQMAVYQLLRAQEEVSSDDIIDVAGNSNLHVTQNIRVKNQLIDQLNMKLHFLLNTNEKLIEVKPSKIDKRIKVYKLRREYLD